MVWHSQPVALCCAGVGQPGAAGYLAAVNLLVTDLQSRQCRGMRHTIPGSACRFSTRAPLMHI